MLEDFFAPPVWRSLIVRHMQLGNNVVTIIREGRYHVFIFLQDTDRFTQADGDTEPAAFMQAYAEFGMNTGIW